MMREFIKSIWEDGASELKASEWDFAKKNLINEPNGTKLRRKDHQNELKHSFLVIDGRILAVSATKNLLEDGASAKVKVAEDEAGNLFVLKITKNDGSLEKDSEDYNSLKIFSKESEIACDLGIAGEVVSRATSSEKVASGEKSYLAYQYLGMPLDNYLFDDEPLSLDQCYELSIKISLALNALHTGTNAQSNTPYMHGDIHLGNVVIDNQGEPHFIDYERSSKKNARSATSDISGLLKIFWTPPGSFSDGIFNSYSEENKTLSNLLKNNTNINTLTALDIAETLTLCRFHLETYQNPLKMLSDEKRFELIQMLMKEKPDNSLNIHSKIITDYLSKHLPAYAQIDAQGIKSQSTIKEGLAEEKKSNKRKHVEETDVHNDIVRKEGKFGA